MENSYQCPSCNGNKSTDIGHGARKCLYCGTVFAEPMSTKTSTDTDNSQNGQTININIGQHPQTNKFNQPPYQPPYNYYSRKSKSTAVLLAFFLGGLGAARFYVDEMVLESFIFF